jgi:ABC-2 type transport system permease protein
MAGKNQWRKPVKVFTSFALPSYSLFVRELIRFFRERSRMIGVIGSPILFWFFIGSGLGGSFRYGSGTQSMSYLEYFFPGTLILIMLFTAIFSTISIIDDRKEGFLQSVLVAPITRSSIVLGKILGGTVLALLQGIIFLLLAPAVGLHFTVIQFILIVVLLFAVAFGLTGLGFMIAWRMDSTQGFHAIMNLFLIPLWLLSGALFPIEKTPGWLKGIMLCNPLTYDTSSLRQLLYGLDAIHSSVFFLSVVVVFGFCCIVFAGSLLIIYKKRL